MTFRKSGPQLARILAPILVIAAVGVNGWPRAFSQSEDALRQRIADLQAEVHALSARLADWPQLGYFREQNRQLKSAANKSRPVVFIGDSITAHWSLAPSGFFRGKNYVNRGLDGQITGQMLLRFQQDVLGLNPAAVVILGGRNEIHWGSSEERLEIIEANIRSMSELAQFNHVSVVICSLTPLARNQTVVEDSSRILALNQWLRHYSIEHNYIYLDYYSRMTFPDGRTKEDLFTDGTHPNDAGYRVMAQEAQAALSQLNGRR